MSKNIFFSIFGITTKDTFFSNRILLKSKNDMTPFAAIEITETGNKVLHVGGLLPKGHVVELDE